MTNWYYEVKGKSFGPIKEAMMGYWFKTGALAPEQMIRKGDSGDWQRADVFEEMVNADGARETAEMSNDVIHSVVMEKVDALFQVLKENPVAQVGAAVFVGSLAGYLLNYIGPPPFLREGVLPARLVEQMAGRIGIDYMSWTATGVFIGVIVSAVLVGFLPYALLRPSSSKQA